MRTAPIHRLRPNDTVWTPPAVIVFDTEASPVAGGEREVLAATLWVAQLTDRRPTRSGRQVDRTEHGTTRDGLADMIEQASAHRPTLWVMAHNLAFDLTVTRLPAVLATRGWRVTDSAVDGRTPWIRMSRGASRLVFTDTFGWLPAPVARLGDLLGMTKPPLPDPDDDDGAWLARCRADVAITAAAILEVMAWWDTERLGRFTITGPGCGWNAYRHRPRRMWRVTINPDPAGVAHDRQAVYGGRRAAALWGDAPGGPFVEADFTAAYPTIAAHEPLPIKRLYAFDQPPAGDRWLTGHQAGAVARCLIDTDSPRWPVRVAGRVLYPVGRFWTWLASPDIAAAEQARALADVAGGMMHRLGYEMADWAGWILDAATGAGGSVPPVAALTAKAWGRSVIGKWGQHGTERRVVGVAAPAVWDYTPGWDLSAGARGGLSTMAGEVVWWSATPATDNTYPAILAWVEAHVRVRLAQLVDAIGPGAVIAADTDGVLADAAAVGTAAAGASVRRRKGATDAAEVDSVLRRSAAVTFPLVARRKADYGRVSVMGPQVQVRDGRAHIAGLRGDAVQVGPGEWESRLWPGLSWQMGHGDARGYVRPAHRAVFRGTSGDGWAAAGGIVLPPVASVGAGGETVIAGRDVTQAHYPGFMLEAEQPRTLLRAVRAGQKSAT